MAAYVVRKLVTCGAAFVALWWLRSFVASLAQVWRYAGAAGLCGWRATAVPALRPPGYKLFFYVLACLLVCLSVCLFVCLFGCLSVCLSVCLFVCMSVFLSVCLSVYLFVVQLLFRFFCCFANICQHPGDLR